MPGVGKDRKPYYVNINKEAAFKTEPAIGNQTAISGEIQEAPSFKPSNEPIRTKSHNEIGANSNVLKGAFRGTLSWSETIQDWRPIARLLGNTIDMVRIIKGLVINVTGTLLTEDNVSGDDGAEGLIEQITFPIDGITGGTGDFTVGETVTWDTTKTAIVVRSNIASGATTGTLTVSTIAAGSIENDDSLVGGTSGTTAIVKTDAGEIIDLIIKQFTKDETLTFVGGGGATATLSKIEGNVMTVSLLTGTIANDDIFTGGTSSARGSVAAAGASQTVPELVPFNLTEQITINTGTMTFVDGTPAGSSQASLIYQHQLSAVSSQNSYDLNYAYVSLDNQHLATGCVMKQAGLESGVNEAPKISEDWLLSTHVIDATRDAEVLNSLDLYQYVNVSSLSIDGSVADGTSVNWTDILKTISATFNRSNLIPIDSHTTQAPTGMKGAEVESTLKFGIHRLDSTIWNLNLTGTDDDFAIILIFARGTLGEDDATLTYSNCRAYEVEEAGEETIFLDVPVEIKGTPTLVINDSVADYST